MKRMKISQRDARLYKLRAQQLQKILDGMRNAWSHDYPGGVNICTIDGTEPHHMSSIRTARLLGHACVIVQSHSSRLEVFALPLPLSAKVTP